MKNILIVIMLIFISSCSNYEVIGKYKYKVKTDRVNTGDYEGIILKYNVYINDENEGVFTSLLKAQKLDFEKENDTVFGTGKLTVKKVENEYYIITKEIYKNGYDKFTEIDSVIRTFKQIDNGKVIIQEINYYQNGKAKKSVENFNK